MKKILLAGLIGFGVLVLAVSLIKRQVLPEQVAETAGGDDSLAPVAERPTITERRSQSPIQLVDEGRDDSLVKKFVLETGDFSLEESGEGFRVVVPGQGHAGAAGTPDLPTFFTAVEGIEGYKAVLEVTPGAFTETGGVKIAPRPLKRLVGEPGSQEVKLLYREDPRHFKGSDFGPSELGSVTEGSKRGEKLVRVELRPFQYNPESGTLRKYESLEAVLTYVPEEPREEAEPAAMAAAVSPAESISVSLMSTPPPVVQEYQICKTAIKPMWPATMAYPGDFVPRRAGAEVGANIRIPVSAIGLHRVTQSVLLAAGVPGGDLVGSQMRLFCRDREVAIKVSTDGPFGSSDFIEFYGLPNEGWHTDENAYWLGFGSGGLRMASRSGNVKGGATTVSSHINMVEHGADNLFRDWFKPDPTFIPDPVFPWPGEWVYPVTLHWYSRVLSVGNNSISVPTPNRVSGAQAAIEYKLYGYEVNQDVGASKTTAIKIGSSTLATKSYVGQEEMLGTAEFSSSLLGSSSTSINFKQSSGNTTYGRGLLERFSLYYPRTIRVLSDKLLFPGKPGNNKYPVSGFSGSSGISILDVTDPFVPVELTGFQYSSGTATFGDDTAGPKAYYASRANQAVEVAAVDIIEYRGLSETDQYADYIVVTPYELQDSTYEFLKDRALDGLKVAVAPVEQIYAEFGYGVKDPKAIKQFLGYAYHHWLDGPPPLYVLLAGTGTCDPKGFRDSAKPAWKVDDHIPLYFMETLFNYASVDGWYGLVDGEDELLDLAIGRIPSETNAGLLNVLAKIQVQEAQAAGAGWRGKAFVTADNFEAPNDFKQDTLDYLLPELSGKTLTQRYLDDVGASTIRNSMISFINNSGGLVNFTGHGATGFLAQEEIFDTSDIGSLNNNIYPVITSFSCQIAQFYNAENMTFNTECLGRDLILRANKAASACFAATTLTDQIQSRVVGAGFLCGFSTVEYPRLGDCMFEAYYAHWLEYGAVPSQIESLSYFIAGCPAQIVNPIE